MEANIPYMDPMGIGDMGIGDEPIRYTSHGFWITIL